MTSPARSLRHYAPPILVSLVTLAAWEAIVRIADIPPYKLPAPSLILATLYEDRAH